MVAATRKVMEEYIFHSQRGDRLRIAPHVHNDDHDLEHFEEALRQAHRELTFKIDPLLPVVQATKLPMVGR